MYPLDKEPVENISNGHSGSVKQRQRCENMPLDDVMTLFSAVRREKNRLSLSGVTTGSFPLLLHVLLLNYPH